MLLLVCGCAVPLLVAAITFALLSRAGRRAGATATLTADPLALRTVPVAPMPTPPVRAGAEGWASLAEEIAGHVDRRPARRSDGAARRRHLAAVLPADARR